MEYTYFDRDLSWLTFNYRVLMEARDSSLPLYERIKFLGIYSGNLDEFFRVRVASLRNLKKLDKENRKELLDFKPKKLLKRIYAEVNRQQNEFGDIFRNEILPELKENGIILYQEQREISSAHVHFISRYFSSKVLSYLQPVILQGKEDKIILENGEIYFVIRLKSKAGPTEEQFTYAYLNIPSDNLPRFLSLPSENSRHYFIFIDDVIRYNLNFLFPGYQVIDAYSIKLNRDADLQIEDEFEGDLVEKIQQSLSQRQKGLPARFLYDLSMPESFLTFLRKTFSLRDNDLIEGGRYHNLNDLMDFPNPLSPQFEVPPMPPLPHVELDAFESMFEAISKKDRVLHFPYQSYEYVLRFFNEASVDAYVEEIKITMYRIAADSFIANSLISAAKNGKKVTVFVEVKARFDEANNLRWAAKMEKAGINIVYSIPGLKVHAKVALISRRMPDGSIQSYAYLGTGNFNEKTALIYADHGIFTCHKGIASELGSVFRFLVDRKPIEKLDHLLVAKHNLQEKFLDLIDREIAFAREGKPARIIIKLNNLQEKVMIDKLYEASKAGVKVDLIIRAICCIVPEVPGQSENIRLFRIVDRFLEHARAYIFNNNGKEEIYMGSADWMKRNLYKRVEVCYPVYDKDIKADIKEFIDIQLSDNVKAKRMDQNLQHYDPAGGETENIRAQMDIYEWLKEKRGQVHV